MKWSIQFRAIDINLVIIFFIKYYDFQGLSNFTKKK